ncbi:MAG: threonine--tRNA ligase [Caldiserica bacterium]|jgi:threonyl-tRNA synthetase|nr:threonine--tRNA ligase [Caldisericota bacterium]MDH7562627.1 threonine--tRNA ligase [Caldisericota bacterium]
MNRFKPELKGSIPQDAIAIKIDGNLLDLSAFKEGMTGDFVTADTEEGLEILRHSTSHLMAQAVKEIFPEAKLGIGPATSEGFYYDFDLPRPLTQEDLALIQEKMEELSRKDIPFKREEMGKGEAIKLFQDLNETFKVELLNELPEDKVSIYRSGDFVDLCRGPHVPSTGYLKHFKLLSVAGAYWRGNERNPMLQRIYGTAFPSKEALDNYMFLLQEAQRRDHRRLGKELEIFSIEDISGAGLVVWHPKGAILRRIIENFDLEEHLRRGYNLVTSPHLSKSDLFKVSGHTEFYRENMYFLEIDEQEFVLKPMNCPFHVLIYRSKTRSYKDLPLRFFEMGTVYRYERSGVLHGLLRVRGFTQDDGHIFCRPDQLLDELLGVLDLVTFMLGAFGFKEFDVRLSTQPEKFIGSQENWDRATQALKEALEKSGIPYKVDPGEGVFYGPKIDTKLKDALGRAWQGPTVQVDFNFPEKFNLTYMGEDGREHQPVMIHRAILGSLERFIGALIEHYAGDFPLWLAPQQAVVIPISTRHHEYALQVLSLLEQNGIRAEVDFRGEKMNAKIRDAELSKIPFLLIVGDREAESGSVSVRRRKVGDLGPMPLDSLISKMVKEVSSRSLEPLD